MDSTDTRPAGDRNALEEDRSDRVALSPGGVGLDVNTTPYEALGGLFLQTTLRP